MEFLYRYVFRGAGLVLLLAMLTVLWPACNVDRDKERKARDEAKRMLDAMHKDADAEIRKYTDRRRQAEKPAGKEKKQ